MDDILPGFYNDSPVVASPPRGGRLAIWLLLTTWTVMCIGGLLSLFLPLHLRLGLNEYIFVLGPSLIFLRCKKLGWISALRLKWIGVWPLCCAALAALAGAAAASALLIFAKPWIGDGSHVLEGVMPETWPDFGWMLLVAALGAGLCEEIMFRGVIQGVLSRRGRWTAIFWSALLFGLFHLNVWQAIGGLTMGMMLGWMVERSGSLLPAIVGHATVNTLSFGYYFATGSKEEDWILTADVGAVGVLGILLFIRATRCTESSASSLKDISACISRWAWLAMLAPLLFGGTVIGSQVVGAWEIHPIGFDFPALRLTKGSYLITVDPHWIPTVLSAGDGVSFRENGGLVVSQITKVEGDQVYVDDGLRGTWLPKNDVSGKIIYTIQASKDSP